MLTAFADVPRGVDLVPAMLIDRPIAFFEAAGVRFVHDTDDLDASRFAAFDLGGGTWIALQRYDREADRVTLMAEASSVEPRPHRDAVLRAIAERAGAAFGVPLDAFRWLTDDPHQARVTDDASRLAAAGTRHVA